MDRQRTGEISRQTAETGINLRLNIDGAGNYQINTGLGFFDHMLALFARHGTFDLELTAKGDLNVDAHHTVEDIGICLGRALKAALGDKAGIARFGHALVPMDESLAMVAVDISGRGYLAFATRFPAAKVGGFDTELVEEFLRALAVNGEFTLHVRLLAGRNSHHICEAIFKALGRALRDAVSLDERGQGVPSTKETL
ncbi:MAG: imidazoleglycerol-phosphate dehydratase HisB [Bacillota bacterium]